MEVVGNLLTQPPISKMALVKQVFSVIELEDNEMTVRHAVYTKDFQKSILPGMKIAITAGSRWIACLQKIVQSFVDMIRESRGELCVLAMGSHGGATATGQTYILEQLGMTKSVVGAPILTIGPARQIGAEALHTLGFAHMGSHVWEVCKELIPKLSILFGLGGLDNALETAGCVVVLDKMENINQEPVLLEEERKRMSRILFDNLNVLIIDEIGKDFSGTGMDSNITGRYGNTSVSSGLTVERIIVLGITQKSDGNALDIGLADVTRVTVEAANEEVLGHAQPFMLDNFGNLANKAETHDE